MLIPSKVISYSYLASSMDSNEQEQVSESAAWLRTIRSERIRPAAKTTTAKLFTPILRWKNLQRLATPLFQ